MLFRKLSVIIAGAMLVGMAEAKPKYTSMYGNWLRGGDDEWVANADVLQLARLADSGDCEAMRKLGVMSMKGKKVKKSAKIAIQWWKKAAEVGDVWSMIYLGDVYRGGNGCQQDYYQSMKYYTKAYKTLEREMNTEMLSDEGNVIAQRIKKLPDEVTLSWWKKRAEKGDAGAFEFLKTLPLESTLSWWKKQAKLQNKEAVIYLAMLKKTQREGLISDEDARAYLIEAASLGHAPAQALLEQDGGFRAEAMERCAAHLLGGDYRRGMEELRAIDSLYGPYSDMSPIMVKLLKSEGLSHIAIRKLLQGNEDRFYENKQETPYILLAIRNKHPKSVVEELVASGFDINAACKKTGETALIAAVKSNNIEAVSLLLESYDLNLQVKDNQNKDAMAYATDPEVKKLLSYRISAPEEKDSDSLINFLLKSWWGLVAMLCVCLIGLRFCFRR